MTFLKTPLISIFITVLISFSASAATSRWSEDAATRWYAQQGWAVGANYIPSNASNTLEMWQRETFDPARIELELTAAEQVGFNSLRVFLHDLVWQQDPRGFSDRINTFLTIAARHHIRPVLVIFDSCWGPQPHLGPQAPPIPGVHNSRWVQSPGLNAVMNPRERPRLQAYVQGVIGTFAHDPRILAWDVWNEPDNLNGGSSNDPLAKQAAVLGLLPQVFAWARAADPSQPLTSGVWNGNWSTDATLRPVESIQLGSSDIISFHSYDPAPSFTQKINSLARLHRPIFCTEYMARPLGSTIPTILPLAYNAKVSAFNWGLFAGKTQTYFAWDTWQHPASAPPVVWFHDLLYPNGSPFNATEIKVIQQLAGQRK